MTHGCVYVCQGGHAWVEKKTWNSALQVISVDNRSKHQKLIYSHTLPESRGPNRGYCFAMPFSLVLGRVLTHSQKLTLTVYRIMFALFLRKQVIEPKWLARNTTVLLMPQYGRGVFSLWFGRCPWSWNSDSLFWRSHFCCFLVTEVFPLKCNDEDEEGALFTRLTDLW